MDVPLTSAELVLAAQDFHDPRREITDENDPYWVYIVCRDRDFFEGGRRLDELVELWKDWGAIRGTGRTATQLRNFLKRWVPRNKKPLRSLSRVRLEQLDYLALMQVRTLYHDLRWTNKLGPTFSGKLLHFLLPETVLLWDTEVVRPTYGLDDDAGEYIRYQEMAIGLARRLIDLEGDAVIDRIEQMHLRHLRDNGLLSTKWPAAARESFPKIFDELAYEGVWSRGALKAIGLWNSPEVKE